MIYKDIEDEIEKNLLNAAISRLVAKRAENCRTPVRAKDEDGDEMTQKEVADCLGISQSYISRLEKKDHEAPEKRNCKI